jgi:ribosomal protein L14
MISNGSQLQVTDNSGAKVAQCINQSGRSWGIGDVITVSIKKAQPRSKVAAGQVRGWRRKWRFFMLM